MPGYIKLFRKIERNPLWLKERFTHAQAWIDLLILTNYKDGGKWVQGIYVPIKRGQCGWSENKLAERWKWSRGKVRRFFEMLKNDSQIERETVQADKRLSGLITIINYEKHQGNDTSDGTSGSTGDGTGDGTVIKKGKKEKKVKKKDKSPRTVTSDEDFIEALKTNPAYQWIDLERELGKIDAWLLSPKGKRRKKTRAFVLNWLNKIEKPMAVKDNKYNGVVL